MIGVAFDRNTIKCRGEKEAGKDLDKTPLLNENTYTRAMKIEASVLPFFMTNCLCLAFSVLSLGPWNWALVCRLHLFRPFASIKVHKVMFLNFSVYKGCLLTIER